MIFDHIFFPDQPFHILSFLDTEDPKFWEGNYSKGLSSLRAQSVPPFTGGAPETGTSLHYLLIFMQRPLPHANIPSGHRLETKHQVT